MEFQIQKKKPAVKFFFDGENSKFYYLNAVKRLAIKTSVEFIKLILK